MTQDLDALLASYLDLARHLDPLRHPDEAPEELRQRLGRFDTPWLVAQAAALRSIAHAIEDLETVESLDAFMLHAGCVTIHIRLMVSNSMFPSLRITR